MSIRRRPSEYAFPEHQHYASRPTTLCHKVPPQPPAAARPSTAPVNSRPERPLDTYYQKSIGTSTPQKGRLPSAPGTKQPIGVDHGSALPSSAASPGVADDCTATPARGSRHLHPHRHHYVASAAFVRSRMIHETHAANAHVVRRIEAARPHYPRTASPWRAQPWPRTRSRVTHHAHRHITRADPAPLEAAAQYAPARPPAPPLALPAEAVAEALQLTARTAQAGGSPYALPAARTQAAAHSRVPHDVARRTRRPPSRARTPAALVYLHACGREAQQRARMAVRGECDPAMTRLAHISRCTRTLHTKTSDTHTQPVVTVVGAAERETYNVHESTSWTEKAEREKEEHQGGCDKDVESDHEETEGEAEEREEEADEYRDDEKSEDVAAEANEEAGKTEGVKNEVSAPASAVQSPRAHTRTHKNTHTFTATTATTTPSAATRAARPYRPTECPLTPYLHARPPATRTAHVHARHSVAQHARGWSGRPLTAPEDYVHTHARAARHELPQDSYAASLSITPPTGYVDTDAAARSFRALLRETRMFGGLTPRSNPYLEDADADAEGGASGRHVRRNSLCSSGNAATAHGSGEELGSSTHSTSPTHVPAMQQATRATHVRANIADVQANASRGRGSVSLAQAVQRAAAAARQQRERRAAEASQRRERSSSTRASPTEMDFDVRLPTDRYFVRERERHAIAGSADRTPIPPHPAAAELSAGSVRPRAHSPYSAIPTPYRAAVAHEARHNRTPACRHALSTTLSAYYRQLSTAQLQVLTDKYREHLRRLRIRARNDERRRAVAQRNALAAKYRAEEERRRRRAGLPPLPARATDAGVQERGMLSDDNEDGEAGGGDDNLLAANVSTGVNARDRASVAPIHEHPCAQLPTRTRLEDIKRAEVPLETVVLMLARAEVDDEIDQLMRSSTSTIAGDRHVAASNTCVATGVYR